jgi:hypothetical protein
MKYILSESKKARELVEGYLILYKKQNFTLEMAIKKAIEYCNGKIRKPGKLSRKTDWEEIKRQINFIYSSTRDRNC